MLLSSAGGHAELVLSVSGLSPYGLPVSIVWGDGQSTNVMLTNGVALYNFSHAFEAAGNLQTLVTIQSQESSTRVGDCSVVFENATANITITPAESGLDIVNNRRSIGIPDPAGMGDVFLIQSPSMPEAVLMFVDFVHDGGGYDFFAVTGGISGNKVTDPNTGKDMGLDIFYP
eukprot:scaffold128382_cov44-Tisochrysis_lutea.AAC.1